MMTYIYINISTYICFWEIPLFSFFPASPVALPLSYCLFDSAEPQRCQASNNSTAKGNKESKQVGELAEKNISLQYPQVLC